MIASTVRERLDREPFEPFRVRLSSGDSYVVTDPHTVALMKSEIFIAFPNSDRWVSVPWLHVAAIEAAKNGDSRPPRRRPRRR
jgi:hypothetical protein